MSHLTFRRIALLATVLGIIANLGAPAILLCSWLGMSDAFIAVGATSVMILTLALQIAFVAMQAFQNGRTPIPVRMMGPDAWLTVIILTALPGVLWHRLAALALPPMQLIMPGYVTPLVNVVLLVLVREAQQRRSAGVRA
jgi:hypothetical protein